MGELETLPEDWDRALAIVAHPDDMEWGAASAVARWTAQGKDVRYLLVTRGEAGIATIPPDEAAPLREREQRASCDEIGVEVLEFLDHPDGLVVADLVLRRDLAAAIRRHRPDVLIGISYRDSWGGTSWNHVDHRAVGVAMLDAARDAANPWVFPEEGEPCDPVEFVAFSGSTAPTHVVDVSDHLEAGIASLRHHEVYLRELGDEGGQDTILQLRSWARQAGKQAGVDAAVVFELRTP
ncbi:PIG-L deacetylase family protein [Egicoccus halophilus]|uniref:GlcNAc-PI de-N-acetylase n=1 Tax=Egicoccus halophilus TaxID=1670830 RepID=A0A8J3A9J8_9ACTN|nr:PIG-L deacetylase family protein [Egicoccus halophilus]GGI05568.1 GlcNAc-PI de-N-acetylase [Egicoccus halophilus]